MLEKIVIKNPGCPYCRHYIDPVVYEGVEYPGACSKGARRIFEKSPKPGEKKRWKWVDCSYAEEKNKKGLCPDYKMRISALDKISETVVRMQGGGLQMPSSYKKELWWNQ